MTEEGKKDSDEPQIQGLWVMDEMATVFPEDQGGKQVHPEAEGALMYDNGRVYASIYRKDDKSPTGRLQFQYAANYELVNAGEIIHKIFAASKPEGAAPNMIKNEGRNFRLDGDFLHITGKSVQHANATIEIKWRRVKDFRELDKSSEPKLTV